MAPRIRDTEDSMALRKDRRGTTVPLVIRAWTPCWLKRYWRVRCGVSHGVCAWRQPGIQNSLSRN